MNKKLLSGIKKILVTGGLGFIGSNYIIKILKETNIKILNLDKKGYASSDYGIKNTLNNLEESHIRNYLYQRVNLTKEKNLDVIISDFEPDLIVNFAAESHVDRSIESPEIFIENNILGTFNLLEATRKFLAKSNQQKRKSFKFHHISTDEVFGSLGEDGFFNEENPYKPRSPYSASKASSDHLVFAWNHTYGLPVIISNCSNNYGPWQFPEKLIPLVILKALSKKDIPIYGKGENIRDWLFVDDHIDALIHLASFGKDGENYCIGGNNEVKNVDLVKMICALLNKYRPFENDYASLIKFVRDRPGHDFRYAIDSSKIQNQIGWIPVHSLKDGLEKTILWYLENIEWCNFVMNNAKYGGQRIGKL